MIKGQSISVSAKGAVVRDGKILVIRYDSPSLHYNLPGGRLQNGQSLREAVAAKLLDECAAEVEVGKLLFVFEQIVLPDDVTESRYQKVQFTFEAKLRPGSEPSLPRHKTDQGGVDWIDLETLADVRLLPPVATKLLKSLPHRDTYDPIVVADLR